MTSLWGGRRRRRWGTVVGCSIASIAIIGFGAFFMWVQHFGTPAQVTVQSCEERGPRLSDHLFGYAFGDSCTATQSSDERFLEFWGVYRKDVGHEIDVHITRGTGVFDEAVPDAWMVPPIAVGLGSILAVTTVIGIARRLRPARVAPAWTGQPWPGSQ